MIFRFAEESDCALILDFIRRLADYENMTDQVVATEELLKEGLWKGFAEESLKDCRGARLRPPGMGLP